MKYYQIDLAELTPDNPDFKFMSSILEFFIKKNPDSIFINEPRELKVSQTPCEITLSHPILQRSKKKNKDVKRYEVLNPEMLAEGSNGQVYKSMGVLIPEEHFRFKPKHESKSRICKVILLKSLKTIEAVHNEQIFSAKNSKLHCKKPVFSDQQAFILMRKAPGEELYYVLQKINNKGASVTIEERLQLSINLILAYKNQVHDLGIIHGDIKPENIIVNMNDMTVTIVDYATAVLNKKDKLLKCRGGTPDYFAPETLFDGTISTKTDTYSLGLTIAQIWGDQSTNLIESGESLDFYLKYRLNHGLTHLFKYMDIDIKTRFKITHVLEQLTHFEQEQRIALEDAINIFKDIYRHYSCCPEKRTSRSQSLYKMTLFDTNTLEHYERSSSLITQKPRQLI